MNGASWLVVGLLLTVAVIQFVRSRRSPHRRWVRLAIVAVVVAAGGLLLIEWLAWPREVGERFTQLVAQGQYQEANHLLADACRWEMDADGCVTLRAADGSRLTRTVTDPPLIPVKPARPDVLRRLYGRWDFLMVPPTKDETTQLVHFTAEWGTVYCRQVERVERP